MTKGKGVIYTPYMSTMTLTSKGQVTLPADIRYSLGLKRGDRLTIAANPVTKMAEIKKVMTIDELTAMVQGMVRTRVKPITDVDAYYQAHRSEQK